MENICLFPGTFDPITKGHVDIIQRGTELFDKIYVGIGLNTNKAPMFDVTERMAWIQCIFEGNPQVEVITYDGLTVDCCKKIGARFILRGLRLVSDFEYEKSIADVNRTISGLETFFLISKPEYSTIASSLVREVLKYGGDSSALIPAPIYASVQSLAPAK